MLLVSCLFLVRNEDLTSMLDSNKDGLKLDAMKLIIGVREMNTLNYNEEKLILK